MEKRIDINIDTFFFTNVFSPFIKQVKYPRRQATIVVINKNRSENLKMLIKDKYKFVFDYPNDNDEVVGIEVFYMGEVL